MSIWTFWTSHIELLGRHLTLFQVEQSGKICWQPPWTVVPCIIPPPPLMRLLLLCQHTNTTFIFVSEEHVADCARQLQVGKNIYQLHNAAAFCKLAGIKKNWKRLLLVLHPKTFFIQKLVTRNFFSPEKRFPTLPPEFRVEKHRKKNVEQVRKLFMSQSTFNGAGPLREKPTIKQRFSIHLR